MSTAAVRLVFPLLLSAAALAQPADSPAMRAVPLEPGERIVLDGTLSHPAWQRAPVFERFVEHDPDRGGAPPQVTRVQVLFDAKAVYVGVTVLDTDPSRIRDDIVRTDLVNRTQDFVVVYVDAIGARRSAQFFRLNAAGSMADGMHTAADDSEDFAPDFDWDGAVARTAEGWTAVFRLPFASLRYASSSEHQEVPWRVMVARRLPRDQFHLITSVTIPREASSFIAQLQRLEGLKLPDNHQFLTLRPSVTLRATRDQQPGQPWQQSEAAEASLDLKWRPMAELVVDAALNPDFSQVALDVPQLSGNTQFALSFPEKRPFFFESSDLLRSPTEAFYTRSFTDPRWGLRGTWRGERLAGSAFSIDDEGGGSVLLPGAFGTGSVLQPGSRSLAARALFGSGSVQLGGLAVSRRYEDDGGENVVAGPDLAWQFHDNLRVRAQWLRSSTTAQPDAGGGLARGMRTEGDRIFVKGWFQGESSDATLYVDDTDAGFRHDSGFVNQAGTRKLGGTAGTGWRRLGPFNEFWLTADAEQVRTQGDGELVQQMLTPGIWSSAARNLEWQLQYRGQSKVRTAPGAPLLHERYWYTRLVMTPATWFPLVETDLSWGKLADTVANQVRPGVKYNLLARLRPARRLELEPSLSTAWLEADGRKAYRETVGQLLGVWHFDARSHLRGIFQHVSLDRTAEPGVTAQRYTEDVGSLTWGYRWSAGTVLYIGATSSRQGPGEAPRSAEAFVKLQADVDELRSWF